jgi:hypothetical protein
LYALVGELEGGVPTAGVLAEAGLLRDPRGGVGGLHAASALFRCHARSGGRRTLVWFSGRRPEDEVAPKLAREEEYRRVLRLLRRSPRSGFPTARLQEVAGGRTRQEVMGAMKLFVAAGVVVHLVLPGYVSAAGLTCWGWALSDVAPGKRVYRPGMRPREPLSLDWEYDDGRTFADYVSSEGEIGGRQT